MPGGAAPSFGALVELGKNRIRADNLDYWHVFEQFNIFGVFSFYWCQARVKEAHFRPLRVLSVELLSLAPASSGEVELGFRCAGASKPNGPGTDAVTLPYARPLVRQYKTRQCLVQFTTTRLILRTVQPS